MSESRQSRASVVRVKGVSFNYLQFLWSGIGQIKQQQSQGNFAGAMALLTEFINYLPDSMKDEFREKAQKIALVMNAIRSGSLKVIKDIPDLFVRGIYRNRLLQIYSSKKLSVFMDELTTKLNQLGYMENLKLIAEGQADVDNDWIIIDQKRKKAERDKKKKGRKKRDTSPQGTID